MRFLPLLLLLLAACQYQSQWHCHQISTKEQNDCTRLTYKSEDQVGGIDLEFLNAGNELISYLQVHSSPIGFSKEDKEKAQVDIRSASKHISFLADFHRGHQRIRIPLEIQKELISLLQSGNPITIDLSGYKEIISPKHFEKFFKKLEAK